MQRRTVVVLLVLVLVGGALLVARALTPATRFTIGVLATGPGEALLLTRRNEHDSTQFWIEHVDVATPLRWSAELTPLEPKDSLGFSSVAVADTRVVVLGSGPDGDVALALDRASGERLWATALPGARADTRIGTMVVIDGTRALLVRDIRGAADTTVRVDALALADGAPLWTHEAGGDADLLPLAPGRLLVVLRGGEASVLDGVAGQVREQIALSWVLCPLPDGLLASHRGQLVVLGPASTRTLPADAQWRAANSPCGGRDGDLVVGARRGSDDVAGVLRVAADTGAPRWQTELGSRQVEPMVAVDGRLPRFLPLAMYGSDVGDDALVREYAVLDLDTGAVVRRAPLPEHAVVGVTGERAWIWLPFRGQLVGFDPATGGYAGATAFTGISTVDLRHEDLRFGELWLHGMGWGRPDALPWVDLDLVTGAVRRVSGEVVVRDASDELRAMFGG